MTDLERARAGAVAIFRLERGDRATAAGADIAQIVELGVIPFGDIAAVGRVDRR